MKRIRKICRVCQGESVRVEDIGNMSSYSEEIVYTIHSSCREKETPEQKLLRVIFGVAEDTK